ncbi:MAG: hypothetical protein CL680_00125 [Blastomonas sp.]|nr:hypothetical protein [Blastomonas sp.]
MPHLGGTAHGTKIVILPYRGMAAFFSFRAQTGRSETGPVSPMIRRVNLCPVSTVGSETGNDGSVGGSSLPNPNRSYCNWHPGTGFSGHKPKAVTLT